MTAPSAVLRVLLPGGLLGSSRLGASTERYSASELAPRACARDPGVFGAGTGVDRGARAGELGNAGKLSGPSTIDRVPSRPMRRWWLQLGPPRCPAARRLASTPACAVLSSPPRAATPLQRRDAPRSATVLLSAAWRRYEVCGAPCCCAGRCAAERQAARGLCGQRGARWGLAGP